MGLIAEITSDLRGETCDYLPHAPYFALETSKLFTKKSYGYCRNDDIFE